MISPEKLFQIEGGQRRRKLALCFGALERDIAGIAEPGCIYDIKSVTPNYRYRDYIKITAETRRAGVSDDIY